CIELRCRAVTPRFRIMPVAPQRADLAWHVAKPPCELIIGAERRPQQFQRGAWQGIWADGLCLDNSSIAIARFSSRTASVHKKHRPAPLLQGARCTDTHHTGTHNDAIRHIQPLPELARFSFRHYGKSSSLMTSSAITFFCGSALS